jgi:quercetin dioxygenase-like cupin family protein
MTRRILVAAAFVFATCLQVPAQNAPVSPSPVKRTVISKIDVPNSNYEVITALLEIAPGFKAGKHRHPGIVSGYVTEGQFWLAIDGQPEKILNAGEGAAIPDRGVHNEGALGDKPLKAIVTYVVEKGQPLVQPVKE